VIQTESAHATTFVNRPLNEVIRESAMVVRGHTGESTSDWGKDDQQKVLYTYTTLTITEVLRDITQNFQENKITMRQPGGSKDGIEMHVPGTAHFKADSDVVVLLGSKNSDGTYDVPGLVTGVYSVVENNGEIYLENQLGVAAIYDPNKDLTTQSYNAKITLDVFRKIAKGAEIPEAKKAQFQSSSDEAKPGSFHGDHHEAETIAKVKSEDQKVKDQTIKQVSRGRIWIPITFVTIVALVGFLIFGYIRRGKV
jgi:hypothetical protein